MAHPREGENSLAPGYGIAKGTGGLDFRRQRERRKVLSVVAVDPAAGYRG
jgi:hypothetical protein